MSVLLPVRNGFPWLPGAVGRILAQTLRPFELIVLEDGSTDESMAYLESLSDPRIRIVATGGVGITRALEVGVEIARGTYITCSDVCDQPRPDRFAVQAALLDDRLDIDVVSTVTGAAGNPRLVVPWIGALDGPPRPGGMRCGPVMARASVLRAAGSRRREVGPQSGSDSWLQSLPAHRDSTSAPFPPFIATHDIAAP